MIRDYPRLYVVELYIRDREDDPRWSPYPRYIAADGSLVRSFRKAHWMPHGEAQAKATGLDPLIYRRARAESVHSLCDSDHEWFALMEKRRAEWAEGFREKEVKAS